jgi:phosphoglycerate dehydrogenase-like enzyme
MSVVIEMIYTENKDFIKYANSKPKKLDWSTKDHAQILVMGSYQKEDYASAHQFILVPFTGLNGLDLAFIKAKGIKVLNTQAHSPYVAERALALMLTLLGQIIPFDERLRHGDWSNRNNENRMPWVSLFEKRIGFFGYGAINQHLHQLLKPFKVKVNIINRGKDFEDIELVNDLDQLIKQSDIVVIAAPLTHETEGIFDSTLLSQMTDKYLINVGRGPIVMNRTLSSLKDSNVKRICFRCVV